MKLRQFGIAILALTAAVNLVGCGGANGAGRNVNLTQQTATDAIKGAFDTSRDARNMGNSAVRGRNPRRLMRLGTGVPAGLGRNVVVNRSHDGGGDNPGGSGGGDGTDGGSGGQEPRYAVGDTIQVSSDLKGIITAVEYQNVDGLESILRLEYDIFLVSDPTVYAGYSKQLQQETGGVIINESDFLLNDRAPSPSRWKARNEVDISTGRTKFNLVTSGRIDDQEGGPYMSESTSNFESDPATGLFSYSFQAKRDGVVVMDATVRSSADGSYETSWLNSNGYQVTIGWLADGTGTFRVVNANDPLCPITGAFDANGDGEATFADGTKRQLNINSENFWL